MEPVMEQSDPSIPTINPDEASTWILAVDDVPENLGLLGDLLQGAGYRVKAASSGHAALRYAVRKPRPDLILLDVMMPEMDGYQVMERLRTEPMTRDIPVIFLTALSETEEEERGFELGAADYITKPIRPSVVLARVRAQIEAKRARDFLKDHNALLEDEVTRRMAENEMIQAASIRALAHLAEIRDNETGNHILRTQAYVHLLADRLKSHRRFAGTLNDRYVELVSRSAPLHDIGKVGIPDAILLKPGKLSAEEWRIMKTHARLGADSIEKAEHDMDEPLEFLGLAKEIAHWHHERWDGSGYPDGLPGDAIPISARLMALADVFDALISRRVYKEAMPFERARQIIVSERGRHFDPDMVDAFLSSFDEFVAIARCYPEEDRGEVSRTETLVAD
jgi:putative two-component system response regulator